MQETGVLAIFDQCKDAPDIHQHPMLARRVLEADEIEPEAEFEFGLECVLDGLAAQVR